MSCTNGGTALALPRASAFSPRLRIVAWSDTLSVRRKLMYGSQTSLAEPRNRPCHSHDIFSSKSLRSDRPQTISYRPKSGALSGRPCSAPPPRSSPDPEMKKRENLRVTTLNIALPREVREAKPMYNFQPKIPPKKHTPWTASEYIKGAVASTANVPINTPMPYPFETQKSYLDSDIKKKIKRSRTVVSPKKDLHLSHRIAHLNAQINEATLTRSGTMLTT